MLGMISRFIASVLTKFRNSANGWPSGIRLDLARALSFSLSQLTFTFNLPARSPRLIASERWGGTFCSDSLKLANSAKGSGFDFFFFFFRFFFGLSVGLSATKAAVFCSVATSFEATGGASGSAASGGVLAVVSLPGSVGLAADSGVSDALVSVSIVSGSSAAVGVASACKFGVSVVVDKSALLSAVASFVSCSDAGVAVSVSGCGVRSEGDRVPSATTACASFTGGFFSAGGSANGTSSVLSCPSRQKISRSCARNCRCSLKRSAKMC